MVTQIVHVRRLRPVIQQPVRLVGGPHNTQRPGKYLKEIRFVE
ncbi:hypothetical protein [Spirosoma fluviale]|nr:hypothetical protein [Spirosoma fluviale]